MNEAIELIKNAMLSTKIQPSTKMNKSNASGIPIPHINFN